MGACRRVKHCYFLLLLCLCVILGAEEFQVDGVSFVCRAPARLGTDSRILILFGGRNWSGAKTLKAYRFDQLADRHRLFLLSPSFVDREYWDPARWSGKTLQKAVEKIEHRYRLSPQKLFLYGYSAGGQCAALFADWMTERVAAWGAHACGVYPPMIHTSVPALITCGIDDRERFQISRFFVYRYREHGGELLWKALPGGHELSPDALNLARAWLNAILSGTRSPEYGEDDTKVIRRDLDLEYRNPLYDATIRELWRR